MSKYQKALKEALKALDLAEDSLIELFGAANAEGVPEPVPSKIKAIRRQVTDALNATQQLD